MALSYEIDPRLQLVMTVGVGVITINDLMDHRNQLSADARLQGEFAEVVDFRSIESLELTPAALDQIVTRDRLVDGFITSPLAVVTGSTAVYGVMRMYSMRTERCGRQVGVFRSFDDALAWIAGIRRSTRTDSS